MAEMGKPLGDRVLLKIEEVTEKKSNGGIILNQTTQPIQYAEVIEVSNGFIGGNGDFIKLSVDVGDKVIIDNGTGRKIRLDGTDYQLVRESEILIKL